MRIEEGIKLDFKDVLFKPKRSSLTSRSAVKLIREFKFKNTNKVWEGIPIIASNMDTVGTISMARELYKYGVKEVFCFGSLNDWSKFFYIV